MTFKSWKDEHITKIMDIVRENSSLPVHELIDVFDYNNMKAQYPTFCPLYQADTKCHDMDDLNCLFCACPYFRFSDKKPLGTTMAGDSIMSECTVNSRFRNSFTVDNIVQCDCSECTVPHTKEFTVKHVKQYLDIDELNDSCSLLEYIRGYQLSNIFGKYKLF